MDDDENAEFVVEVSEYTHELLMLMTQKVGNEFAGKADNSGALFLLGMSLALTRWLANFAAIAKMDSKAILSAVRRELNEAKKRDAGFTDKPRREKRPRLRIVKE